MSISISHADMQFISRIASRAFDLAQQFDAPRDMSGMMLDLIYGHACCPIDLQALLDADDSNFAHDVFGIERHINRQTRQIEGCFVPRFARRNAA